MLAAGYNHQSTLPATARYDCRAAEVLHDRSGRIERALQRNPAGGWSRRLDGQLHRDPASVRDPACDQDWAGMADTAATPALGGAAGTGPAGVNGSAAGRCYWRFADFDNLVEDTDKFQGYGEVNFTFHDGIKLHVEGLPRPDQRPQRARLGAQLPARPRTRVHSAPFRASRRVPAQPRAMAIPSAWPAPIFTPSAARHVAWPRRTSTFLNQEPAASATLRALSSRPPRSRAGSTALGGVFAGALIWRPLGIGGNPLFCDRDSRCPALGQREQDTYRVSGSLDGSLPWLGSDTHWNVAATMSESHAMNNTPDMLVDRLQLALEGLGSKTGETACNPNIAGSAGNAAAHCYYLNPFSTGIASNKITGAVNPNFAAALALDPRVVNSAALVDWIYGGEKASQFTEFENQEMVFDALLSGTLPWKLWGSDPVAWAVGAQFRKDTYSSTSSAFTDNGVTPCIDTVLNGDRTCAGHNGPYGFYGNYVNTHFSGETKSIFGELEYSGHG